MSYYFEKGDSHVGVVAESPTSRGDGVFDENALLQQRRVPASVAIHSMGVHFTKRRFGLRIRGHAMSVPPNAAQAGHTGILLNRHSPTLLEVCDTE